MTLNRSFYSFAIFIWAVGAVITLFQGISYFLIAQQTYLLNSFFYWHLFSYTVGLLGLIVLLKYFQSKKYQLPFWTTVVGIAVDLLRFVIATGALLGSRELLNYYTLSQIAVIGTWILLGLSLIFTDAGKRNWLKLAGIFYLLIGVILITVVIWYLNSASSQKFLMLEPILKWTSVIAFIGPILIMMNFMSEQKQLAREDADLPSPGKFENSITVTRLIVLLGTVILSLKLSGETVSKISWENRLKMQAKEWGKVAWARTFRDTNGDTLKYQLIKPLDFDPNKKYPMVVCLPYGGGIEGAPPAQLLMKEDNREKYQSFLFVPFCPNGSGWGGIPNYPTMDTLVFEAIENLQNEENAIDADRIYVSGVSRGGYGSWHFISLRPDMFAAAMPVCGGGDPSLASNLVNVAVWAFHGEDDINVPVSGSRDMIAAIKKSGGDPKYTEFEGAGHDIWHYVTITPGVLDWLFEQKRGNR